MRYYKDVLLLVAILFPASEALAAPGSLGVSAWYAGAVVRTARATAERRSCEPAETSAREAALENAANRFCADPYASICDGAQAPERQRAETVRALIHTQAFALLAGKFGYSPATELGFDATVAAHPELRDTMVQALVEFEANQVTLNLGGDPMPELEEKFDRVRSAMLAAIDLRGISEEDRLWMRSRIRALTAGNGLQLLRREGMNPKLLGEFFDACDFDGLKYGAFKSNLSGAVFVCPGFLLGEKDPLNSGAAERLRFGPLALLLGHELTHAADAMDRPRVYSRFERCLSEKYPDAWPAEPVKQERYLAELSADTWAAETLALMAGAEPSRARAFELVRQGAGFLCGLLDDSRSHPSGRFRLDVIFGRNPRLRQALGCLPNAEAAPGCSVEGRDPDHIRPKN